MRTSALSALLVLLVACSARSGLQLPQLGTVGDPPPPDATVGIVLLADGTIQVEGADLHPVELHRLLELRTGARPRLTRFTYRPSSLSVLLRCDARTKFHDLIPVLHVLRDPSVRIPHVYFAVEHPAGREGAFAWFPPHDDCGCGHDSDPPELETSVRLDLAGGSAVDPAGIYASLRSLSAERRECPEIAATGEVPVGAVLAAADACLRAGASGIVLVSWPQNPRNSGTRLDGELVTDSDRLPPVTRVRGAAGFAKDVILLSPVIDPIVDEALKGEEVELPAEEVFGD